MKKKTRLLALTLAALLLLGLTACREKSPDGPASDTETPAEKPVLYLYPQTTQAISVGLDLDGTLGTTWPAYDGGWDVTAQPDGTLTDADGHAYPYLFWDGVLDAKMDISSGFCVPGTDTGTFLRDTLATLGLNEREATDFIVYWLPRMEQNAYNLIAFQQAAYTDAARLQITPAPDSLLRVFMAWKPLEKPLDITPQALPTFARQGFTAVEWDGCELP